MTDVKLGKYKPSKPAMVVSGAEKTKPVLGDGVDRPQMIIKSTKLIDGD